MSENENEISTVEEYRLKRGEPKEVTVPTGPKFKVKVLSVMDYIQNGLEDIPNEFFKFIAELNAGTVSNTESPEAKKNFELFEKFLQITVEHGIIDPPVVLQYNKEKEKTHLVYAELAEEDQIFLLKVISGKLNE